MNLSGQIAPGPGHHTLLGQLTCRNHDDFSRFLPFLCLQTLLLVVAVAQVHPFTNWPTLWLFLPGSIYQTVITVRDLPGPNTSQELVILLLPAAILLIVI